MITLKNRSTSTVTEDTFTLDIDGQTVIYKEFLNDKNKVIDCQLRDENGEEIPVEDGAAMLEEIQEFVEVIV